MLYIYVYTGDKDRNRKTLDEVIEKVKDLDEEFIFAVNDLQSIAYLKEKGFKALNIDAIADLFNLLTPDDTVYLCTPEDKTIVLASFRGAKEIC